MYICMYVCMYVCVCVYVGRYVGTYVCMYISQGSQRLQVTSLEDCNYLRHVCVLLCN